MHTTSLPRTCLGFTNFFSFVLGSLFFVICLWCSINIEFFKDVNYAVTQSSIVFTIANFLSLQFWYGAMSVVLLPLTIVIIMTSCFGILGAGCRVKCALKTYIFFLTVLTLAGFWLIYITGIYNLYTKNVNTEKNLQYNLQQNYGYENQFITHMWDYLMLNYKCCGVESYLDFQQSKWQIDNMDKEFPVQCCILKNESTLTPVSDYCPLKSHPDVLSNKDTGCFSALNKVVIENKGLIIFFLILLTMFYCTLVLFAYCIIRGEPLVSALAGMGATDVKSVESGDNGVPSKTSLENMIFTEEPPKKIVKVVSSINPFQTYTFSNQYERGEPCYINTNQLQQIQNSWYPIRSHTVK